jgi:4-amino-4-deoxy-L-arabinose transferase-like glycosyltransferase
MNDLSNLNDVLLSPLGLAPLVCAALVVVLLRSQIWMFLKSLRCSNTLYVIALTLSIITLAVAFHFLQPRVIPWGGEDRYFPRALNIIEHGVFGTGMEQSALFPPGYSFLLVPLAFVLEGSRWSFFLTNVTLLLVSTVIFRRMLILLGASEGLANVFSLLFYLYPNRILSTLVPFSDVPFSLFFVLAFTGMLLSQKRGTTIALSVLTGIVAGAAALVRSNGLLLLAPLVSGFMVSHDLPPRDKWRRAVLMLLLACAVLLPWTVRNYVLFHRLIPVSNNGGLNLALGNNPKIPIVGDNYTDTLWTDATSWERVGGKHWDEAQRDSYFADLGLHFIQKNPGTFVALGARRIVLAMAADSYAFGQLETYTNARSLIFTILGEKRRDPAVRQPLGALYTVLYHLLFIVNNSLYYLLLFFAAYGLLRANKQAPVLRSTFLLVVVIVWLTISLTFGVSRFKEPIGALLPLVVCMYAIVPRIQLTSLKPEGTRGAKQAGTELNPSPTQTRSSGHHIP